MKTYKCNFMGRRNNAIGVSHPCECLVDAVDKKGAELALYDTYEHLSSLTIEEHKK